MTQSLPFYLASVIFFCLPAMVSGQTDTWWKLRNADSTGFVPIQRSKLTEPSDASTWWKRTLHNHLFDFSDDDRTQTLIVVDPVLQAHIGSIRTKSEGGSRQAQTWWDNIRGARFQGIIEGKWQLGGELLERQGLAEPLLGHWATQYRIPGWGRSKLGKDGGYNTVDEAYFDVMFARGWVGRQHEVWGWDAGIDALHIGAGRSSAFLSRQAVPAPYLRLTHQGARHRTSLWSTRWMSTRRGISGETAESLLERSRALFFAHHQSIGPHIVLQGIYNFSWETVKQEAAGGWKTLGLEEGEMYTPTRHVAGLDFQFHQRIASVQLIAYAQQSMTWLESTRSIQALTRVIGINAQGDRWMVRAEWAECESSHCRDCHTIEDGSSGLIQTELSNAGMSLHSLWRESAHIETRIRFGERWMLRTMVENNNFASGWNVDAFFELQPIWPLRLWVGIGQKSPELLGAPFEDYASIRAGVHAGVLHWN